MDLLKEEVVSDELLLDFLVHAVEGVELAFEVTGELVASGNNLGHDLVTLLVRDTRSERESLQVTADTDTGGLDEGGLFRREGWADELIGVHVGDVGVGGAVAVILLDDLVEEVLEGGVGVLGTGVAANARVEILAAREDAGLEGNASLVALVMVLVPDGLGEVPGDSGVGAFRELGEASEVIGALEVVTAHDASTFLAGLRDALRGVAAHC